MYHGTRYGYSDDVNPTTKKKREREREREREFLRTPTLPKKLPPPKKISKMKPSLSHKTWKTLSLFGLSLSLKRVSSPPLKCKAKKKDKKKRKKDKKKGKNILCPAFAIVVPR